MVVFYSTSKMASGSSEDQHTVLWLKNAWSSAQKPIFFVYPIMPNMNSPSVISYHAVYCAENPVNLAPQDACQTK